MPEPTPGVPRAALRVLLLLREMGVGSYEPGVALQLLEVGRTAYDLPPATYHLPPITHCLLLYLLSLLAPH